MSNVVTSRSRMADRRYPDIFVPDMDRFHRSASNVKRLSVLSASVLACGIIWAAIAPYDERVSAVGTITADLRGMEKNDLQQYVSALVPAEVEEVFVKQGERFRKGDILIQLDLAELQVEADRVQVEISRLNESLVELNQVQASVEKFYDKKLTRIDGKLNELQAEIERKERIRICELCAARARSAASQSNLSRMLQLQKRRSTAESVVELAKAESAAAQAQIDKLKIKTGDEQLLTNREHRREIQAEYELETQKLTSKLNQIESQLEQAGLQRKRLAEQLEKNRIVAPYDGVVTRLEVARGDWLERGRIALEIAPEREFVFMAQVNSRDLRKIEPGQEAAIYPNTFDRLTDDALYGVVTRVEECSTLSSGEVGDSYHYPVAIRLNDNDLDVGLSKQLIRLGMDGSCRIRTGQSRSLLAWLLSRNFKKFNQP